MGFNIAGIITNQQLENKESIKQVFGVDVNYTQTVEGEMAMLTKHNTEFDIYTTPKGSIVLFQLGEVYDFVHSKGFFVQFMISDTSGTYYFEQYQNGEIERKLIVSEGEILTQEGTGVIHEEEEVFDKVVDISNALLGVDDFFNLKFKRFVPST